MKKTMLAAALVAALFLPSAGLAHAGNGAVRGTDTDANAPALGEIDYLFNKAGYHFWFTAEGDLGPYVEGQSYHNVYKYEVDDPSEWCVATVADRAPYDVGGTEGQTVYYQVWNVTTETLVCPS